MSRVICVVSSKGGVGKTTVSINIAAALVGFGRVPLVIDGDLYAPNVGLHLGSSSLPVMVNQVLNGEEELSKAVYLHQSGVRVMPASIAFENCMQARHDDLPPLLKSARAFADVVIVDCPSGLGKEARCIISSSDAVLLVTTPDLIALTDTLKVSYLARSLQKDILGVVVNQVFPNAELSSENIASLMDSPVLVSIPHECAVQDSLKVRHPVVYSHPDSLASLRFKELAAFLIGDTYLSGLIQKQLI